MIQELSFNIWVTRERESEIGRSKHCDVTEESYDATTLIRCNFCHVLSVAWSHYYAKPVTHRRSVMSDLIAKNVKNCQHHHWFFLYIPKKKSTYIPSLDILFRQITTFIKFHVAFAFWRQTLWLIDFTKIYQLKGREPKNKGHTNFYECCDLTKKYI